MTSAVGAYSALAESMWESPAPNTISEAIQQLPILDNPGISLLTDIADAHALVLPRRGWDLLLLASLAGRKQRLPAVSLAGIDLQLSLAASYWGLPRRAAFRARRAGNCYKKEGPAGLQSAASVALNLLPWTRPNFDDARNELEEAVGVVRGDRLNLWAAHGLHALAFAELLTGLLDLAGEHLAAAAALSQERGYELLTLRILRTRSGWLWRRGERDAAAELLDDVQRQFEGHGAQPDSAIVRYQQAMRALGSARDYPAAETLLRAVQDEFSRLEMDLWAAQAANGIAQAVFNQGRLTDAHALGEAAARVFARHGTLGLQADADNDLARVEHLCGDLPSALARIERSIGLYAQVGAVPSVVHALVNKGRFLISGARYQQALSVLERAMGSLSGLGRKDLEALCEFQVGFAWLGLDHPDTAENFLQSAFRKYGETGRPALQAEVLQVLSQLERRRDRLAESLASLAASRRLAEDSGDLLVRVSTNCLLAEALHADGQPDDALAILAETIKLCQEHALALELVIALTILGEIHLAAGQGELAEQAWQQALDPAKGVLPQAEARIRFNLARQAFTTGDLKRALVDSQAGVAALKQIRRDFWQPRLAAGYIGRWEDALPWAADLAARQHDPAAALNAIEAAKAQSFIRFELAHREPYATVDPEALALRAEMVWLMAERQAEAGSILSSTPRRIELTARLKRVRQQYEEVIERSERRAHHHTDRGLTLPLQFDLDRFKASATARYGPDWMALDYIVHEDTLVTVWLSSRGAGLARQTITGRQRLALETCQRISAAGGASLLDTDFSQLAALLLPPAVTDAITPDMPLLIAPYGLLHDVPWPALRLADDSLLVQRCRPIVAPSLEAWLLLADRPSLERSSELRGVVVAVSQFENGLTPLPGSLREVRQLAKLPGLLVDALPDELATATALTTALAASEEAPGFLHLATHLFVDRTAGRLSGIALHKEMLLLDQIQDLPRLPPLVFLSGCNGTRALAFPGDERQDFLSALLLAGSQHIIGSLWKIPDEGTLPLIEMFYKSLVQGREPAAALAESQRRLAAEHAPWWEWGGYQCVGP